MTTLETKFHIDSWVEEPYREADDQKWTRADVVLTGGDGLSAASESLMYYRADGTSDYLTLMHVTGVLDGRSGTFVLRGQGVFDGGTARTQFDIVPGSGTGDLASISGSAEVVAGHDDYPHMPFTLRYDLG
jgi:hypothetical protein